MKGLALTEHKIYCKSTIRSKEPSFNLKIETPSPNTLSVHFNIEKSSYFGSFKFSKLDREEMDEDYALLPSQLSKFNVIKAKIEHKKLLAKLGFVLNMLGLLVQSNARILTRHNLTTGDNSTIFYVKSDFKAERGSVN